MMGMGNEQPWASRWAAGALAALSLAAALAGSATAKVVHEPNNGYSVWLPDGWYVKCPSYGGEVEGYYCFATTEYFGRFEEVKGQDPLGVGEMSVWVSLWDKAEYGSCDNRLATTVGVDTFFPLWSERTIGGRKVLSLRTYATWNFPPNLAETVCFEERGKLVTVTVAGWVEPSPRNREYLAILDKVVSSFRWLSPQPTAATTPAPTTPAP